MTDEQMRILLDTLHQQDREWFAYCETQNGRGVPYPGLRIVDETDYNYQRRMES